MGDNDRDDVREFFSPVGWFGVGLIALACVASFFLFTITLFWRLDEYAVLRNILLVGNVGVMIGSTDLIIRELAGLRKKNKRKRK